MTAIMTAVEQIEELKANLWTANEATATMAESLAESKRLVAQLTADLELARKVADAAVGWQIAHKVKLRFIMAEAGGDPDADAAYRAMVGPVFEANNDLVDAITEYRAHVEGAE